MFFCSAASAQIEIKGADIERILMKITQRGLVLHRIHKKDPFNAEICVDFKDYKEALEILDAMQVSYSILNKSTSDGVGNFLARRAIMMIGLVLLLTASLVLPGRIMFVQVSGNSAVPARLILEAASQKGICFGMSATVVRSEKIKNALLEAIPELKWVGVNTSGCVATIHVRESSDTNTEEAATYTVSSLVASSDGVVSTCIATKGNLLCRSGQAVTDGQVLISGYTDCGIVIKATRAEGEIFAQTRRYATGIMPLLYTSKGSFQSVTSRYSLRIGKKLIKFNNSSGIYDGSCAKIYEEYCLSLPGGFVLPVSVIKETVTEYSCDESCMLTEEAERLESCCKAYVRGSMLAGSIETESVQSTTEADTYQLSGEYICHELISRRKPEDILQGEFRSD